MTKNIATQNIECFKVIHFKDGDSFKNLKNSWYKKTLDSIENVSGIVLECVIPEGSEYIDMEMEYFCSRISSIKMLKNTDKMMCVSFSEGGPKFINKRLLTEFDDKTISVEEYIYSLNA